jgi:hypothetical protein
MYDLDTLILLLYVYFYEIYFMDLFPYILNLKKPKIYLNLYGLDLYGLAFRQPVQRTDIRLVYIIEIEISYKFHTTLVHQHVSYTMICHLLEPFILHP